MNKASQVVGRHVVAVSAAALTAAVFHLPQPFLIVLTAFLLACENSLPHDRILFRIAGAWAGSLCGIVVMTAFPDQPWMLVSTFGLMVAACLHFASRTGDDSITLVTGMGAAAGIPAGILHPAAAITAGGFHAINIACGILSAALAFSLFPVKGDSPRRSAPLFSFRMALSVGVITAMGLVWAALFIPHGGVILVIASYIMGLRLFAPGVQPFVVQKTVGAVLGVLLGAIFNVLLSGMTNDITFFLLLLAAFFAALAWIGEWRKEICPCMAQAGAMFAVAAPALPRPDISLFAMGVRIEEVLLGCAAGLLVYFAHVWGEGWGKPKPALPSAQAKSGA
jgi:uncharacterized membrane protein YccC